MILVFTLFCPDHLADTTTLYLQLLLWGAPVVKTMGWADTNNKRKGKPTNAHVHCGWDMWQTGEELITMETGKYQQCGTSVTDRVSLRLEPRHWIIQSSEGAGMILLSLRSGRLFGYTMSYSQRRKQQLHWVQTILGQHLVPHVEFPRKNWHRGGRFLETAASVSRIFRGSRASVPVETVAHDLA